MNWNGFLNIFPISMWNYLYLQLSAIRAVKEVVIVEFQCLFPLRKTVGLICIYNIKQGVRVMKLRFEVVAVLCTILIGLTYAAFVYINMQEHTFMSELMANPRCFYAYVRFCFAYMYQSECGKR